MTRKILVQTIVLLALPVLVQAQPSVSGTSGTWNHKAVVTITGSGFGSKGNAAPVVFDDASGANINDKWDGAWPNNNPTYNTVYRSPMRGISLPHSHITRYIAGAHGDSLGANAGYNFFVFKTRSITTDPAYTYVSWYQRADNAWVFGQDNNFKTFAVSTGGSPYDSPTDYWYLAYNTPLPDSTTSGASYIFGTKDPTGGSNIHFPDANGNRQWWGPAVNPMSGVWTKVEMEIKYTGASNGYIKLWENGELIIDYFGPTDNMPGSTRTEGVGGYARMYGEPNNWRYLADVYLDYSRARVILGNAPTYNASTTREVQIPQSWSGSSITLSVNLGRFNNGQTAYLYVVDPNGNVNANGFPITAGGGGGGGGGGDTTPPTVTSRNPASGATGVATTTSVTATFSEAMNAGTITPTSFELRNASNVLVASAISYNSSTRVATLDPSSPLSNSATYTARVKGGSAGVKDSAGNALAADVVWSFTTAAAAGDTTPPSVSITSPSNGATVSGVVQVSASASDNVGVAGVGLTVDTVVVGSEDTGAPYSISWDTTTVGNGTHTLVAVARDAAGNMTQSAGVTVTVANTGTGTPGLVAAYGFTEPTGATVNDKSGKNNNGTITGAVRTVDGKFGTAVSFDGVNDWITVNDSASLDLTTGMTIEAWVKPSSLTGWRSVLMKEVSGGLSYALYANDNDPKPAAYVRIAGKSLSDGSSGTAMLPANTWTHLAATYDGATLRIFINGVEAGATPVTGTIQTSTSPLHIGGNTAWGEYFQGVIDEVRIYNRALGSNEIVSDMNTPVDAAVSPPAPPVNVRIVQ